MPTTIRELEDDLDDEGPSSGGVSSALSAVRSVVWGPTVRGIYGTAKAWTWWASV